ncbi:MAG: branched-chain amino acid ABC transporter permease [Stellaceae bacterium]
MARASGYFKTSYAAELRLVETRLQRASLALLLLLLAAFPFAVTPFLVDLANQLFLAVVGSVALMLLTGYAGQVSLGHAGLLAAGAFTAGILSNELAAGFWIALPASALVGAGLGLLFGLPSLRLRGLYLAISTLALYFVVALLGGEYETRRGFSTGILLEAPRIASLRLDGRGWYFLLLAIDIAVILFALNLLRAPTGRAWRALRGREIVAEALGISVRRAKLSVFVTSSVLTAVAGTLFAYYRGFVSIEAFSLFLSVQYVAMVIIGGLGSILGAVLGAGLVVLLPYLIEESLKLLASSSSLSNQLFAVNAAAFGAIMILFLLFEPQGLVGIWRRLRDYFLLWPFRRRPIGPRA